MLEFIKKNYLIFCTFIIVRIFFYILLNILDRDLLTVLQFMDGENYIDIANNGYNKKYLYAFFPLIPLLIRYFGIYFVFILNNILVLLSAILLKKEYNESTALLFLLSPIQIYCSILYTESIFIFLCILSIYLIKRKKYILTGLCLGIGVCCRSMMSMLFFSIFIVMCYDWYKKNCTFKDILKTYIPATIISCIYPIYLQIVTGNWKLFNDIQFEWWSAEKSNIFKTILLDIIRYLETRDNYELFLISLTYISLFGLILVLINSYYIDKRLVLFT